MAQAQALQVAGALQQHVGEAAVVQFDIVLAQGGPVRIQQGPGVDDLQRGGGRAHQSTSFR